VIDLSKLAESGVVNEVHLSVDRLHVDVLLTPKSISCLSGLPSAHLASVTDTEAAACVSFDQLRALQDS
jgi:hypothetical protein